MPVPLWTPANRAEAKYNVITEFPKLGLHAAAASGNVGLVEYALEHGQPINSVLDGVLPIHAASAGGHPQVVKLLIEHGADVNAARLPRRYFNDKNRDASAPIVGTSGSTPLHFAAANGNTDVITLLLLHGAHPDRADKYGVTPEALARENNWLECAQILHDWVLNKDRDLREREALSRADGGGAASPSGPPLHEQRPSTSPEPESPAARRRLHVKHSIDTALNILKSSSGHSEHSLRPNPTISTTSPPPSPFKPFGEYSFYPDADGNHTLLDPQSRRPSLPHILPLSPPDEGQGKAASTLSTPKHRRPCSAGTGADRSPEPEPVHLPFGRGGSGRKLGTKLSLLFKKAQHGETSESVQSHSSLAARASSSTSTLPLGLSLHSRPSQGSTTDAGEHFDTSHNSSASRISSRSHARSEPPSKGAKITPQPSSSSFLDLDASIPPSSLRPPLPSAVDLHNALAQQQTRDRSRSNATNASGFSSLDAGSDDFPSSNPNPPSRLKDVRPRDDSRGRSDSTAGAFYSDTSVVNNSSEQLSSIPLNEDGGKGTIRPGILRGHTRTASSGQSSASPMRSLRFDSASSTDRSRKESNMSNSPSSIPSRLKSTASSNSLQKGKGDDRTRERERSSSPLIAPNKFPSTSPRDPHREAENDEQAPIRQVHPSQDKPEPDAGEINAPSALLLRQRGMSFGSSSETSLSPIFVHDGSADDAISADFPFSIHHPPPLSDEKPRPSDSQLHIPDADRRGRGDSLSSTSTTDSANMPQYSTSGSTVESSASATVSTPGGDNALTLFSRGKPLEDEEMYQVRVRNEGLAEEQGGSLYATLNERRAHSPLDIDISLISSHAQAEELVERTRQDILELATGQELGSGPSTAGPTPLSARLAAYGESLALERRLREQERVAAANKSEKRQLSPAPSAEARQPDASQSSSRRDEFLWNGVERQLSLDKSGRTKARAKTKDPRRPSTADGLSTRHIHNSFFPGEHPRQTHQTSLSLSPPGLSHASTSFDRRDFSNQHQRFASQTPPQTVNEPLTAPVLCQKWSKGVEEEGLETLSRISSLDGVDTESEAATLTRIPATPLSGGGTTRGKRDPVRSASSVKKLTRMGFSANDQMTRTGPPSSGKLLGGFKSIMQTLKGKS